MPEYFACHVDTGPFRAYCCRMISEMSTVPLKLLGKEHYELMAQFEAQFKGQRLDREPKVMWARGQVYQSGETNALFLAFRQGYAFAKAAL
jgi:hypothetical protein